MKTQRGAALVEFAIIALLFFMLLFGIIEFGRTFFTYNTLVEATRRGARVAAVCPVSDNGVRQVKESTIFDVPEDGQNTPLLGLTSANVNVTYLKSNMTTVVTPPLAHTDVQYDEIAFVRVQIQNFNNLNLIIPGLSISIPVPPVVTTLPSESLGRINDQNPTTIRQCCFNNVCV